jgi:LPS-assembly protein
MYVKHYTDLTKDSNEDTLQQLPIIHYHHYLESFLDDHVTYNIDVRSNNIHREINKKVTQTDFNIPVSVHTSLFDEYIDLEYVTNLYAQHSSFSGSEKIPTTDIYEDGYYARNDNVVSLSTQLTKAYDEFSHVMGFGTSYRFKGGEDDTGYYRYNRDFCQNPVNANHARCDFYNISEVKEELKLNFAQYVFDATGSQKLYHRLSQNVLYTGIGSTKGDLENELEYEIVEGLQFYNNMFYNHKEDKLSKIYDSLSYRYGDFDLALSHLYEDTFIPTTATTHQFTNYLTSYFNYRYSKFYSYHFAYDYDIELKKEKRTEIGFLYSKRCWDFGLKFVQNNRPVLDASGNTQGLREKYIYFTISLKPFMSTGATDSSLFAYKLPKN